MECLCGQDVAGAVRKVAAALLLLVLALCPGVLAKSEHYDAIVIGAGVSGLTAARRLQQAGARVVLLEAQSRAGGRLQRKLTGRGPHKAWVDLGGQWAGVTQYKLLGLVKEFGLKLFPSPADGQHTFLFDGRRTLHRRAFPSTPYNATELQEAWPEFNLTRAERDDLVETWLKVEELSKGTDRVAPWQRPDAKHLDATTVASWVDATATTPVGNWWTRVMCRTWGGLGSFEASDASMLHLAWSQSNSPQEELPDAFLFDGGAAQVVELLAKQLSPGTVKLRSPVAVLRHSTHSVSAVTYRGEHYSADAVVVAMPPHLTGRVRYEPPLPAARDALVQRVPMGALIKVLITYKTPFWRDTGLSGIAMGNLQVLETVADSTNPRPGSAGVLASFISGDRAAHWGARSLKERHAAVLADLVTFFGPQAASPLEYNEGNWPSNPWEGGAYAAYFTPGTWTEYGHSLRAPVGRIFWAGTETAKKWAGYIDGGISAGEDAAKAVLDLLQVEKAQGSSTHNSNTTRSSGNIKTELRSSRQEAPLPASTY